MNQQHPTGESLAASLAALGVELPTDQIDVLDRYCRLLWQWNERLNLTRHTTHDKFAARDVVDSLALAKLLQPAERVLDVGTGGGVPGVVLAVVRPDLKVSLCESVAKKAKAVQAIVRELNLQLPAYHARAEELLQRQSFDALVARAVAPLTKLLTWLAPHWPSIGRLLVIQGPQWTTQRAAARERQLLEDLSLRKADEYVIPGTDALSVVLEIRRK